MSFATKLKVMTFSLPVLKTAVPDLKRYDTDKLILANLSNISTT